MEADFDKYGPKMTCTLLRGTDRVVKFRHESEPFFPLPRGAS